MSKRKRQMERLDKLWSKAIVERDKGLCRKCPKQANNPHHVFYRTKLGSRWVLENGINLCEDHHVLWAHAKPKEFMEWWINEVGEAIYFYVKVLSLKIKPNLDEIEQNLNRES